jgi:hypothetical protein
MQSHIFPEWLYKPLYDDNHRFFVLSTDVKKKRGTRPKGIYERLLCGECEHRFSTWEEYARSVFYELPLNVTEEGRAVLFSGVQYTPFKLFQMSLIWRASIASRPEVHRIDLGPHVERIRKMLFEGCPGEAYQYGSILMLPALGQELMQQFLYPPKVSPQNLMVTLPIERYLAGYFGCSLFRITQIVLLIRKCFFQQKGAFLFSELGSQRQGSCSTYHQISLEQVC